MLRDQIEDWKYLISSGNKTSRGFYIGVTVGFALLLVISVAVLVAAVMGVTSGVARVIGFAMLPMTIVLVAVAVKLLNR